MRNRKPTFQVRASAVNSVSHKNGVLFAVLASADFGLPKDVVTSAFGCEHCGTTFAGLKDSEPFCITCGSDQVAATSEAALEPEVLSETQELSGIICAGCDTHNILSDVVAAKLGGKMHCVMCGDALEFDQPTVGDGDDDMPEVNPMSNAADDADDLDLGPDGEINLNGDNDGTTEASHPSGDADDLHPPVDATDVENQTAPFVAPEATAETVDVPMTDAVPEGADDMFDVGIDDEAMVATVNHVPVATLMRAEASQFADVWGKQAFVRSIKAAVSNEGRNAALAHFGFKPIIASFPLKKLVDERVESGLAAEKLKVVASTADLRADYHQSLAIAAAGLQKNFFKGHQHALKAGLCDELIAAGVRNPVKLIDRVFATHGGQFMNDMLELAAEMLAKPAEVRNELARSVEAANYIVAAAADGDDESPDDDEDEVEASTRMQAQAGLRIKPQHTETSSIRDLTGGRRLFGTPK